jgi:D-mannonate dehydratase
LIRNEPSAAPVPSLAPRQTEKSPLTPSLLLDFAGMNSFTGEVLRKGGKPTSYLFRMLQIYSKAGFSGPIRPDHAPTIEIDKNDTRSGYTMGGKVFVFGYMKGIMEALDLPYS